MRNMAVAVQFGCIWIAVLLVAVVHLSQDFGTSVIDFQYKTGFVPTEDNYGQLYITLDNWLPGNSSDKPDNEVVKDFSLCLRFKTRLLLPCTLITLGSLLKVYLQDFDEGIGFIRINSVPYMFLIDPGNLHPNVWNHACFSFDSSNNNNLTIVVNGKDLFSDLNNLPALNWTLGILRDQNISLGLDPDSSVGSAINENLLRRNLMHGQLTEVYMWTQLLSRQDMVEITSHDCKEAKTIPPSPDLFDFSQFSWESNDHVTVETVNRDDVICKAKEGNFFGDTTSQ